jgi:hypothetical protein
VLAQFVIDALSKAGLANAAVGEKLRRAFACLATVHDSSFDFSVLWRVPHEARIRRDAKEKFG